MIEERQLFETYFQRSSSYYIDRLLDYRAGKKITFNLYAFLFGILWLLYRKMYAHVGLLIAILFGLGILEELFLNDLDKDTRGVIDIIQTLASSLTVGLFSNYFIVENQRRSLIKLQKNTIVKKLFLKQ